MVFKVIWVCTTRRIYVKFFGPCCTRYNVRRRFRRRRWFGNLDRANLSSLNLAWSKIWSWCILVGWLGNVCVMGWIFVETIWWSLTLRKRLGSATSNDRAGNIQTPDMKYLLFIQHCLDLINRYSCMCGRTRTLERGGVGNSPLRQLSSTKLFRRAMCYVLYSEDARWSCCNKHVCYNHVCIRDYWKLEYCIYWKRRDWNFVGFGLNRMM